MLKPVASEAIVTGSPVPVHVIVEVGSGLQF